MEQIFKNLETGRAAGEAKLEHVNRWNMYVRQGQSVPNENQA